MPMSPNAGFASQMLQGTPVKGLTHSDVVAMMTSQDSLNLTMHRSLNRGDASDIDGGGSFRGLESAPLQVGELQGATPEAATRGSRPPLGPSQPQEPSEGSFEPSSSVAVVFQNPDVTIIDSSSSDEEGEDGTTAEHLERSLMSLSTAGNSLLDRKRQGQRLSRKESSTLKREQRAAAKDHRKANKRAKKSEKQEGKAAKRALKASKGAAASVDARSELDNTRIAQVKRLVQEADILGPQPIPGTKKRVVCLVKNRGELGVDVADYNKKVYISRVSEEALFDPMIERVFVGDCVVKIAGVAVKKSALSADVRAKLLAVEHDVDVTVKYSSMAEHALKSASRVDAARQAVEVQNSQYNAESTVVLAPPVDDAAWAEQPIHHRPDPEEAGLDVPDASDFEEPDAMLAATAYDQNLLEAENVIDSSLLLTSDGEDAGAVDAPEVPSRSPEEAEAEVWGSQPDPFASGQYPGRREPVLGRQPPSKFDGSLDFDTDSDAEEVNVEDMSEMGSVSSLTESARDGEGSLQSSTAEHQGIISLTVAREPGSSFDFEIDTLNGHTQSRKYVTQVGDDSESGVLYADHILKINGISTNTLSQDDVALLLADKLVLDLVIQRSREFSCTLTRRGVEGSFGFGLATGSNEELPPCSTGHLVSYVNPGTLAEQLLEKGDMIIEFNERPAGDLTHDQVLAIIKASTSVKLRLRREPPICDSGMSVSELGHGQSDTAVMIRHLYTIADQICREAPPKTISDFYSADSFQDAERPPFNAETATPQRLFVEFYHIIKDANLNLGPFKAQWSSREQRILTGTMTSLAKILSHVTGGSHLFHNTPYTAVSAPTNNEKLLLGKLIDILSPVFTEIVFHPDTRGAEDHEAATQKAEAVSEWVQYFEYQGPADAGVWQQQLHALQARVAPLVEDAALLALLLRSKWTPAEVDAMVLLYEVSDSLGTLVQTCVEVELRNTTSADVLLRGNSSSIATLGTLFRRAAQPTIIAVVGPLVQDIDKDPNNFIVKDSDKTKRRQKADRAIATGLQNLFVRLQESLGGLSDLARFILFRLRIEVQLAYPQFDERALRSFVFLRCVQPAIFQPDENGMAPFVHDNSMRAASGVCKVLSMIVSAKSSSTTNFDPLIQANQMIISHFIDGASIYKGVDGTLGLHAAVAEELADAALTAENTVVGLFHQSGVLEGLVDRDPEGNVHAMMRRELASLVYGDRDPAASHRRLADLEVGEVKKVKRSIGQKLTGRRAKRSFKIKQPK